MTKIFTILSENSSLFMLNEKGEKIASSNPSLGLPLLPAVEEDLTPVFEKCFKNSGIAPKYRELYEIGVEDGYKAASTKKWSDEDMFEYSNWVTEWCLYNKYQKTNDGAKHFGLRERVTNKQLFAKWRSIYEKKKPIAVEVEMELVDDNDYSDFEEGGTYPGVVNSEHLLKVDENNFVIVKRWIYEKS